ncbi:ribosome maturation factor RimM [Thiopseudomonas denitrificans]|uniref:Ribosome maturation factor RimM n=1 Tax=Thiopseudomonas denitrificans TaxID=1501432 RepID=A0A4R6TUH7_9GAMM|nr:ribosome maturation factor RimM [Thiopseudomonas denitrificans]TDQ36796.1 16S rRNA processing protein RimM [Thiopseudomonas denitrificans]
MSADDLIVMGKIGAVHGVRGEVKIHSFTDPMENLFDYPLWHLRRDGETRQVRLASARSQGKGLVARIEGLEDREIARTYTGFEICVPRSELPELEQGEYYWHQLVGLQVVNREQQLLGKVSHLLETGANDVLVVRPCAGSLDGRERLLPYTDDCVEQVDLDEGVISVEWDADF